MLVALPQPDNILITPENWESYVLTARHGFLRSIDENDVELVGCEPATPTRYFELSYRGCLFALPATAAVRSKACAEMFSRIMEIYKTAAELRAHSPVSASQVYGKLRCGCGQDLEFSVLCQMIGGLGGLVREPVSPDF